MEKELFPPIRGGSPMADRSPRMDRFPSEGTVDEDHHGHGGCGCGCGSSQSHENGVGGSENGSGCGCTTPVPPACGGCMGYEGCGVDSWGLCEYPLAMVYAPCQTYRGLYDPAAALSHGTLFTELDLPLGQKGCGGSTVACSCGRERRQS